MRMVLYDDKKWLCRLIRTAFTIEDDSGVCEKVLRERPFLGYDEDPDSSPASSEGSFDIRDGSDVGHRRRSNTAIRLEKLDLQKKAQNATQFVRVTEPEGIRNDINFEINTDYENVAKSRVEQAVNIDQLLNSSPHPDAIPYALYAKFEASCHPSVPCKKMAVFISFLPFQYRPYPIKVAVVSNAKIIELIGLILWLTSKEHPDVKLKSVHQYNLQISDEDGEWDNDFPPLDHHEMIAKFSFGHLVLVTADGQEEQSKNTFNYTFLLPNSGQIKISLADPQITTVKDALTAVLQRSGWNRQHGFNVDPANYHLEKLGYSTVFKDLSMPLSETKCTSFCVVRNGAKSIQNAKASEFASSKPDNELPGASSSEFYIPVTVTGRFNRVRNALCVIRGRDRMDLEFQAKTKPYPFSQITGVKLDAAKNRVVVSIIHQSQTTVGNYYSGNSHLQLSTADISTATELHHRLQCIINSFPKFVAAPLPPYPSTSNK